MPLPFAPPPKESKVYTDLKNLKITGVTADQMDTLKGELYAQGVDGSEDEMRRLKLLGEVSNQQSSSGPIPGTGEVAEVTDTTGSGSPVSTLIEPNSGEAYEVSAFNWETKNANAVYYRIRTPTATQGALVEYKTSSGTADITTVPVRIVYPQTLVAVYGTATGNNTTIIAYHRIR